MKNLNKIFKGLMWLLVIIGVVMLILGFTKGFPQSPADSNDGIVNGLLYYAYFMVGLALFIIIVFGIGIAIANNPKSLVRMLIVLALIAVVCVLAYVLAPASPAVGILEQPTHATLKLTDTVMNLTYFAGAAAIVAIIFSEVYNAVRNK